MKNLFQSVLISILALTGYIPAQTVQAPVAQISPINKSNLGATNAIETPVALFATSLVSSIASSATSMTLVSGLTLDGTTLASSTYGFVIDEGTAVQEFVKADCTNITCTNMQRGLSVIDGISTISSLQQPHRRGASVKIATAPLLLNLTNFANGIIGYPVPIKYSTSISTSTLASDRSNLASAGLVADTAFAGAGIINATAAAKGIVEIATQIETASTTLLGSSGATVVIPASNATSTYNSATSPLRVVVTRNNGTIDPGFISGAASATFTGTTTFSSTATSSTIFTATSSVQIGSFPAYNIGKNIQVFTSSGTFQVPLGITKIYVEATGAGGGGGGGGGFANGGGGGGSTAIKVIDVSATTSIGITIGASGAGQSSATGQVGGTTYVSTFITANGGLGGVQGANGAGGLGGTATGGDINIPGGPGGQGFTPTGLSMAGAGGSSIWGGGPYGSTAGGNSPLIYGTGGGGGNSAGGGNGMTGIVKIMW